MPRSLTPQDLYALRLADDPQIAPNGDIAFVRVDIDHDAFEYRRSIWLTKAGVSEPRRLTNGPNDTHPRWSPDGRTLAFLRAPAASAKPKNREERERGVTSPQVWLLSLDGGEPRQLTTMRYGVGDLAWAPDGGSLALVAKTGQPDDAEVDDAALEGKTLPRVRVIDQLWHKLDTAGYIYEQRSHIFTVPIIGGEPRQLTDGDWDDESPSFSPDGRTLVFVSDRAEERWEWPAASVWTYDLLSGEIRRRTDESLGAGAPTWSPDGQHIAFIASPRRGSVGHTDLYVTDTEQGEPGQRLLSGDFAPTCADTGIDDMRSGHGAPHLAWTPDSQQILFLASTRGATHVFAARADGQAQPRALTSGGIHAYSFSASQQADALALAISTPTIPGDVYVAHDPLAAQAEAPTRLTEVNRDTLAEVALAEPEEFTFTGADGWELQGWTLRPAEADREQPLPTILEIHGGPAAMYGYSFFLEFQLLAARGYAVVYVNPRGSTGYGRLFSGAVLNDWGGKDFQDIMAGLDAAIGRGGIDPDGLGVAGGSYGGFMTNWAVSHSDRFKAGVTMRCVANMATMFGVSDIGWALTIDELNGTPWDDLDRLMRFSPITYVKDIHTPLLILHSDQDLRCPIEQGQQMYSALKFLGRETKMVVFEGQSHELSRSGHPRSRVRRLDEILAWFERYIPVGAVASAAQ